MDRGLEAVDWLPQNGYSLSGSLLGQLGQGEQGVTIDVSPGASNWDGSLNRTDLVVRVTNEIPLTVCTWVE